MLLNSKEYTELSYAVGNEDTISNMPKVRPLQTFDDNIIEFLNSLSKKVIEYGKGYSDVVTFGFWCRKASLLKEKEKYDDLKLRFGRGIVFHSTPSNVAVNFAFSLVAGLLAGNANIVRLPAKDFEQVNIICDAVNELLSNDFKNLEPYICMVKYVSNPEIHQYLSLICDSRVIWGGDDTVNKIRKYPLSPSANEITFTDRHSIVIINADEYLNSDNKEKIAQDFYNDTYLSDQNACTSPRIVFWMGNNLEKAKDEFWSNLYKLVKEKYELTPVQSVGKLSALYKVGAYCNVELEDQKDQLIMRLKVNKLDEKLMDYKYNSGFFFEYDINELKEILPICSKRCQTLTYFGVSKDLLEEFLIDGRPNGVDRAVKMGKSMDFSFVWDGYDLIRELSRKITIG